MANLGYGGRGNAFQGFGSTGNRSIAGREPTDGEVDLAGSKHSACTREGPVNYREYIPWEKGFHAILRSVNGAGTMRLLLDHKAEFVIILTTRQILEQV